MSVSRSMAMFWRIYAVVLAIVILPLYSMLMKASPSLYDFLDMVVAVGALMGFFGYAYEFRIISMKLWKVYFFLVIAWDLFYNILISMILDLAVHFPNEGKITWLDVLLSFMMVVPEYIALFLYGFRSDSLWTEHERQSI
jgi:hypothetical protein